MIDLDRLIKLIRLANNNPNEHEANLAARRACKMLINDKGDFIFKVVKKAPGRTWNDVQRSETPDFSTKPPKTYGPGADFWKDFFTPDIEEIMDQLRRDAYNRQTPPKNPFYEDTTKTHWKPPSHYPNEPKLKYDRDAPPKTLNCTKCRKDVETKYVGHPGTFICHACHWQGI